MNDMTLFLDLILLASGVYCMYTWLRLAVTKHLFKNGLLVPKEKKISDCADEAEYIRYMTPPLAVMAILTLAYGVIMLLNDQLSEPFLPYPWSLVPLVVVLASLVWYAVRNGRANVTLKLANPAKATVWAIDVNGKRLEKCPATVTPDGLQLTLSISGRQNAQLLYEITVD